MRYQIGQRVDYILNACRDKKVLHLGCADMPYTQMRLDDGTLLYQLIEKEAAIQYGVDLSIDGIQILQSRGYINLAVADVQRLTDDNPFGTTDFDVIIAGEIIEHLSNPGLFLESLKPLLSKSSTRLILTTINAYCAYRFVYSLLMRDESVHPDHVSYYSRRTLAALLLRHGYVIENFSFYPIGKEHERYINKGRTRILYWIDRVAGWINPILADGLMVTCKMRAQA